MPDMKCAFRHTLQPELQKPRATYTIKSNAHLLHVCESCAAREILELIVNYKQITFRYHFNEPLPNIIEVWEKE